MQFPDHPFFVSDNVCDSRIILTKDESFHATKVLRLRPGDTINVTDGRGNYALAEITQTNIGHTTAIPLALHPKIAKHNYDLHIAISPLRNADRLEWMIEKCVEMGIDAITPVVCERTIKRTANIARLTSVIVSACKQSQKVMFPVLNPVCSFPEFINQDNKTAVAIAHCNGERPRESYTAFIDCHSSITLMIGPEGDFSATEIDAAMERKIQSVHLGDSRLRTETAGMFATAALYARYGL